MARGEFVILGRKLRLRHGHAFADYFHPGAALDVQLKSEADAVSRSAIPPPPQFVVEQLVRDSASQHRLERKLPKE